MDPATVAVAIVSIITAKGCVVLKLWLRLRWQVRHQQERRHCLTAVAEVLAIGGRLEFDDQHGDGDRLYVQTTRTPDGEAGAA